MKHWRPRRVPGLLLTACGVWAMVSITPPAAGAAMHTTVRYRHYAIDGASELRLMNQMRRKGPRIHGRPALAATRMQAHYSARLLRRAGARACRVRRFALEATFTVTLPQLSRPRRLSPAARKRWRDLSARLKRHEGHHIAIWKSCLRRVAGQLPRLSAPDCNRLKYRLRSSYRAIMARCEKRHDAFDNREHHVARNLPFIRAAIYQARHAYRARRH